ncbi:MAG: TIGR01212 family radical SAM protein [Treponema sp.]|nr:TIGR01212 family radical SAM protein [Treponema sp.]
MIKLSDFYQSVFGTKVYKIALDAGCTCPNRDGTKGTGGCIFCSPSGSGEFASDKKLTVKEQIEEAKKRVESKIQGRSGSRRGKYIAYFQNFTSTYGDAKILSEKYREALLCEDVAGLCVATRPDCIGDEILSELLEISKTTFVQIELGLQTSNEKTGNLINRCYTNEDYSDAVCRIKKTAPEIHVVTHLIFGLPGETEKDMLESVRFVVDNNNIPGSENPVKTPGLFGIKITSLFVLKDTPLLKLYNSGEMKTLEKEEYLAILKKALPLLGENCVVHRLTGDPPKNSLIAPVWTTDKKRVLNDISGLLTSTGFRL